jgi:hypothetical protein
VTAALILAACPLLIGAEPLRVPAGCALPGDAACLTIAGAVALEGDAAVGRACIDACDAHTRAAVIAERHDCDDEAEALRADLDAAIDAHRHAATALDGCSEALGLADDTLRAMADAHAAGGPVLPGWAWAAAGAAAPMVGLGVCALSSCDDGARWGAAAGAAAIVVGAAVLVEW